MENAELKHYIDTQLAGGTSPEELKRLLAHHGWAPEIVDAHFPKKNGSSSVVPPTPSLVSVQLDGANKSNPDAESRKMCRWGIALIILPFATILLALVAYAVAQFWISNYTAPSPLETGLRVEPLGSANALPDPKLIGLGSRDSRQTVASIVNVVLSLVGILGVLGIIILVPIGIILIARSRRKITEGMPYDERSGKGDASVIPVELGNWNWGAAFLSLWWGIYYKVWICFLVFVPAIGPVWWIVMGIKGNEWAWQKNKWASVEEFKKSQKKWAVWAIISLVLNVLMFVVVFVAIAAGAAFFSKMKGTTSTMNTNYGSYQRMFNTNSRYDTLPNDNAPRFDDVLPLITK